MDISAAEQSCEPWSVYWKRKKMSVTCADKTPCDCGKEWQPRKHGGTDFIVGGTESQVSY